MFNTTVLMSDADHFSTDQPINPYYNQSPVDFAKAKQEHSQLVALFKEAGITVLRAPSPADSQDGVYTANWALVRGDTAVIARLPNARVTEEAYAEQTLAGLGKNIIRVPSGLRFSGQGDALPFGNLLLCGQGYRSDQEAQAFAAKALGYQRIQLQTIPQLDAKGTPVINDASGWPDSFFYDIDLALAIIRPPSGTQKGIIAYCPKAFTEESRQKLEALDAIKIHISWQEATEAFACNLVSTGKTVIMSDRAPELAASLRSHGLQILQPSITELIKGGGYIRCTSLSFN